MDVHQIAKHDQLVNALIGAGIPSLELGVAIEKQGLAQSCGNQWNPDYEWRRSELKKLSIETLEDLYAALIAAKGACHAG